MHRRRTTAATAAIHPLAHLPQRRQIRVHPVHLPLTPPLLLPRPQAPRRRRAAQLQHGGNNRQHQPRQHVRTGACARPRRTAVQLGVRVQRGTAERHLFVEGGRIDQRARAARENRLHFDRPRRGVDGGFVDHPGYDVGEAVREANGVGSVADGHEQLEFGGLWVVGVRSI